MTESPCSAFEASSRSPSFLICLLFHLCTCICLSIYMGLLSVFFFACLVLHWSISLLVFILPSSFPPLLTPSFCCSPCLSASCYCNHLFTQPVAHFLPSPVSYSQIPSDFIMLTQEKALLSSLPNIATNSDHVFLFVAVLWCVRYTCVHICAHMSLHYIQWK